MLFHGKIQRVALHKIDFGILECGLLECGLMFVIKFITMSTGRCVLPYFIKAIVDH